MKKIITSIFVLSMALLWFAKSQSISLMPEWEWVFWNGCIVPIDVYVDPNWEEIAAMDLMFETSLNFVNFVATWDTFQSFFTIVKSNNLFHIVGFSVDASERAKWLWKIGTLYFSPKEGDIDWVVRLYYLWEWYTTDTNLSILWWVDVLKNVLNAYVSFSDDVESCENIDGEYEAGEEREENWEDLVGEQNVYYAHVRWEEYWDSSYEAELAATMGKINDNPIHKSPIDVLKKNIWIMILLLLIIVILLVNINTILSSRKELSKWKKKWNKRNLKKS